MPEGPEVRTVADQLGQYLNTVKGFAPAVLLAISWKRAPLKTEKSPIKYPLEEIKVPAPFSGVRSMGKKLIFTLQNPDPEEPEQILVSSLGMTGRWFWSNRAANCFYEQEYIASVASKPPPRRSSGREMPRGPPSPTGAEEAVALAKHMKVAMQILFPDGRISCLCFADMRCFGGLALVDRIKEQGPDLLDRALTKEITQSEWNRIFTRRSFRNKQIGQVLLDQDAVAGIGNYLKAEILYEARISPFRIVSSLSEEDLEALRLASHRLIVESYRSGGLTIENFQAPDGAQGVFTVKVYGKDKDPEGRPVVKSGSKEGLKDGRATHWVPDYQV